MAEQAHEKHLGMYEYGDPHGDDIDDGDVRRY